MGTICGPQAFTLQLEQMVVDSEHQGQGSFQIFWGPQKVDYHVVQYRTGTPYMGGAPHLWKLPHFDGSISSFKVHVLCL